MLCRSPKKKMNQLKIFKAAFNAMVNFDPKGGKSLEDTISDLLDDLELPNPITSKPEVSNKSAPTFDTLDFDEIEKNLDNL